MTGYCFALCLNLLHLLFVIGKLVLDIDFGVWCDMLSSLVSDYQTSVTVPDSRGHSVSHWERVCRGIKNIIHTVKEQIWELKGNCRNLRGSSPALCLSQDCQHCWQYSLGGWRSKRRACGSGQDVGRTARTDRGVSPVSLYSTKK